MAPHAADPTSKAGPASEATPLLGASETVTLFEEQNGKTSHTSSKPADISDPPQEEGKPMPYLQICLLCYTSLGEPVAYFSIFPFISEMIQRNGHLDEKNVGFWAGLIESLFSLVQMVLMIFYGRAADRLGRKPVLVFSLTGIAIATAMFGMSQSLLQMILYRCLAGCFAGSVVTVRTMLSEITTKETQGRAFSWYMFMKNVGIFIGPIVGGGLANPSDQYPRVFGRVRFFEQYPYALATFVAGGIVLSSALACLFFLNETLKRKEVGKFDSEPPMSTWKVLSSPGVPMVLYIYGHNALVGLMYTAVLPVFMYTSVKNGGLGFSDPKIALFLGIGGGSQALWMLIGFPLLQKRLGTGTVLRACVIAWPIFIVLYPIGNEVLRNGWTLAFWIAAPITMVIGSGVAMAYGCVQLCLNDIGPSPTVLGTLNALALTITSGVRAFAPILATSIFATGVKWGFADGHLVWFIFVPLAAAQIVACHFLPEAAEGRPRKPSLSVQGADSNSTGQNV